MIKQLRKFFACPFEDRRLLVQAAVLLTVVRLLLALLPMPRLQVILARIARMRAMPTHAPQRILWAATVASRYVPWANTCLMRALVVHGWFQQCGFPTTLCIGVTKDQGRLKAHAWIESEGQVVLGGEVALAPYITLATYPA